ncbi:mannitol dehydrogenase family protein [Paraglaciecola chathamensis]|uniref:mannitol dehydrogenase family protein n=1 Tax=Paraglaciecola chathamensis TaxID=368405 RepID=UPI00270D51F1|nr:mannitol dehydrogenase family protein [Paraglaciecola chathamensis]MDO6840515.1 mannitol dehydrogenase family protein [Paraglaciecola chathamensis]
MTINDSILLNQANLSSLPDSITVPNYDRSQVTAGIVHIGVGGFHRSHEAFYTDDYMQQSGDLSWGICGVGLREGDRKMQSILQEQDYLYTLVVKHPNGQVENRVIGCLTDFLLSCDAPQKVIDKMASDETKIVSLTITEGGYNFNPVTDEFDFTHPDVVHDLANPGSPRLVFGYLAAALKLRKDAGKKPFTIQSCDNIQHNGNMTRKMLLAYVGQYDKALASWIAEQVQFPNAMVDRITPATTAADMAYLAEEVGVKDNWPVVCEPFLQWIIEDKFSDVRPLWEQVGAQFVADVTPYEKMKIRLLNAGHSVLGILGSIDEQETIDGAVQEPLFARYLRLFMDAEVTPILDPVDGIDLTEYKDVLFERFANPNIKDNLSRICLESSSKVSTFLLPTLLQNLANDGDIACATLVVAAWCYYSDKQVSKNGKALDINDVMAADLHKAAQQTSDDPLAFLQLDSIFADVKKQPRFVTEYKRQIETLYAQGDIKAQMQAVVSQAN